MSQTGPGRCTRKGISLKALFKRFPNDAAAERWFVKLRWPDGIACHYCGSTNVQVGCKHKTMPFRCREKECAKRFSVRTGTVMRSSKLGFHVWAIATYLMTTNLKGISSMKMHRELNITQKSAWHLAHRLRAALPETAPMPFAGPVEADETFVGGKAKNMHAAKRKQLTGRGGADKTTVAGVRDRATGKVRAAVVQRTDGPTLKGFVTAHSTDGATVYTDEATAYEGLPNRETVKHGVGEYVKGLASINGMESFWSMLKRGYVGVFHRMSTEHLPRYVGGIRGTPQHPGREHHRSDGSDHPWRGRQAAALRRPDRAPARQPGRRDLSGCRLFAPTLCKEPSKTGHFHEGGRK